MNRGFMIAEPSMGGRAGLVWLVLLIAGAIWCAALEVPYLSGRIVDQAGLLSAQAVGEIEGHLEKLEQETGSQVAVLIVASLEGEVVSDYSLQVAETWKLGRGAFDDDALLLISRDDRKMRLEVGYGLEPILTDAMSKRILDDIIAPRFRAGDFDGGVRSAIGAIDGLVRGDETLPAPAPDSRRDFAAQKGKRNPLAMIVFLIPMTLFSAQALGTRGCTAWFLYVFLMPFWLLFPLAIAGKPFGVIPFVVWAVGFPILWVLLHRGSGGSGGPPGSTGGRWGPIVFPTGGWSSSGGGFSGGFGGGGFSGGGGSFGGGGASGSW